MVWPPLNDKRGDEKGGIPLSKKIRGKTPYFFAMRVCVCTGYFDIVYTHLPKGIVPFFIACGDAGSRTRVLLAQI